ncbi:P-loop containing nucleoside triphosphate hydrolase protein [Marasmius fiardii PR-910]|nr:P-loop containing nucleoside triphosphate hydrolase protein [Marasmius fiardii PR-910]
MESEQIVECPICSEKVPERDINTHIDGGCSVTVVTTPNSSQASSSQASSTVPKQQTSRSRSKASGSSEKPTYSIFQNRKDLNANTPQVPPPEKAPSAKKRGHHELATSNYTPSKRNRISSNLAQANPLAERLRPQSLDAYIGHRHLTSPDSLLMKSLEAKTIGSMIFWGPPGCGKTTLARLIAKRTNAVFKELSATIVGINDIRPIFEEAKNTLLLSGRKTVLFLDEVHRFNKSQQDIFLPFIEQGHIQLIGATTENPSFKLTGALLSRCRVLVLQRLTEEDIEEIIRNAVSRITSSNDTTETQEDSPSTTYSESSPQSRFPHLTPKVVASITSLSAGDARTALSLLELVISASTTSSESALIEDLRRSVSTSYDRTGDSRYDLISALHKSVRGNDADAAMYWLARMLTAGEDPLYIARRMVVCASEDIGLADAHALPLAMAALQACQVVGMPECRINLAHIVTYLAEAPKSTRSYEAYNRAEAAAKADLTLPVPLQVRNAPTGLMKDLGYSEGYRYNPEYAHPVHNTYLPPAIQGQRFVRQEGDMTDKLWDEEALKHWERVHNTTWEGRK